MALAIIPKEMCLRFQNLNSFVPLCTVVDENNVRLVSVLPLWRFLLLVSLSLSVDIDANQCGNTANGICRSIFVRGTFSDRLEMFSVFWF